jgi:beta-xylosidase
MSGTNYVNWVRLLTALGIVVLVGILVAATAVSPIEPVIRRDFPDPAVLGVGDTFYAYSTASRYGKQFWHVPIQRATELTGPWTQVGDALPVLPEWALRDSHGKGDVTAPEVAALGPDAYLLYFVARSASLNAQCIGAALAGSPAGPFHPQSAPLVCQQNYVDSIDPQAFVDHDRRRYLLYASGQTRTTIWLQQVSGDGTIPIGDRSALMRADRPEEANIVEAPSLAEHAGHYLLFYSGNTFNSGSYFVNYAIAPTLLGPYTKHDGQFLNRADLGGGYTNPGGQTLVADGRHHDLVFHASVGPSERAMFVDGVSWGPDGRPVLQLNNGLAPRYAALNHGLDALARSGLASR